jgi:hypothetical protein
MSREQTLYLSGMVDGNGKVQRFAGAISCIGVGLRWGGRRLDVALEVPAAMW